MFTKENIKMKLFGAQVDAYGGLHFLEDKTNKFIARPNIEVQDIKISNSSSACVIAVFYTEKETTNQEHVVDEEKIDETDIFDFLKGNP